MSAGFKTGIELSLLDVNTFTNIGAIALQLTGIASKKIQILTISLQIRLHLDSSILRQQPSLAHSSSNHVTNEFFDDFDKKVYSNVCFTDIATLRHARRPCPSFVKVTKGSNNNRTP